MVNVTKSNFIEQSNDLLYHLPTAAFIAVDEEMTGIQIPGSRSRLSKDQPPSQRYDAQKEIPERYAIIQLGIALFHPATASAPSGGGMSAMSATEPEWLVRRYNFFMFPASDSTREVVMNPSAIHFLNQHNLSFDCWTKRGIPYQTSTQVPDTIKSFVENQYVEYCKSSSTGTDPQSPQDINRKRVELRRAEDVEFFDRSMARLRQWLDDTSPRARPGDMLVDGDHPSNIGDVDDDDKGSEEGEIAASSSFLLPPCNAFLRRAFYEAIPLEYPALQLEDAGGQYPNQIRVLRLSPEERKVRQQRLLRDAWEDLIVNKVGMWRIFDAISQVCQGKGIQLNSILFAPDFRHVSWDFVFESFSQHQQSLAAANAAASPLTPSNNGASMPAFSLQLSKIDSPDPNLVERRMVPIVVHNGMHDLLFLLTHFHAKNLPEKYSECKALLHEYFPVIYDTKTVTTECSTPWHNDNSNLSNLFQKVVCEHNPSNALIHRMQVMPSSNHNNPDDDDAQKPQDDAVDQEHEAAYDAFMTGAVYIGLCNEIKRHTPAAPAQLDEVGSLTHLAAVAAHKADANTRDLDPARYWYGRNKIYQMSMYTMDLEQPGPEDPMARGMDPAYTWRVAGIDPSVTTRDIIECLAGLVDDAGRRVNYELIWVDDVTFMVAASYRAALLATGEGDAGHEVGPLAVQDHQETQAILQCHGSIIEQALRSRFQKETITSLAAFMQSIATPKEAANESAGSWLSALWSLFG